MTMTTKTRVTDLGLTIHHRVIDLGRVPLLTPGYGPFEKDPGGVQCQLFAELW